MVQIRKQASINKKHKTPKDTIKMPTPKKHSSQGLQKEESSENFSSVFEMQAPSEKRSF